MVKLTKTLRQIAESKILVIGDILLDTYTIGQAKRISPEAPVAVLKVEHEEHRPGGAGNVVLNLLSLGAQVAAVGRIGADPMGETLKQALAAEGVDVRGMVVQQSYPTPVKNRVIAGHQQIVRIDRETIINLPPPLEKEIISLLPTLLSDVDVIAISDYGKGFLTKKVLQAVIQEGKARNIPVIADPKGSDFSKYSGVTILKPNLGETFAAANMMPEECLDEAAQRILSKTAVDVLMVTRAESGISLYFQNGECRRDFPVKIREVKDVTGAGDTVLAVLAWALANKIALDEATELSNIAAGIAIERFGCARVSLAELAKRLLDSDVANKVFDVEHLSALIEVLRGRRFILLSVSSMEGLTSTIFQSIRKLREKADALIVFIRDENPCEEFVNILSSLHEVDFLILNHENLKHFTPDEIYIVENADLRRSCELGMSTKS